MDQVVACVVGIVNLLWFFTPGQYDYYASWKGRAGLARAVVVVSGSGALTGLVAVAVAGQAGWQPNWAAGLGGGAASLLLVGIMRADLVQAPAGQRTGPPKSIAGKIAHRLVDAADVRCARQINTWAVKLSDDDLILAAQLSPERDAVKQSREKLLAAAEQGLRNPGTHESARGQLIRYICKSYREAQFRKPALH